MTRLESLPKGGDYEEDVIKIQKLWWMGTYFRTAEITYLWEKYSEHMYASWLIVSRESVADFADWLQGETK